MAICPSNCTTPLVQNPQEECKADIRQTTPARFIFFPCNTEFPDPIDDDNIAPLFENGTIVASRELAEVVFTAPTYEEIRISDCRPSEKIPSTREVTFRDLIAVTGTTGSPGTPIPYFDYDFWQDKVDSQSRLGYGIVYCNGDVKIARNQDGSLMTADMAAYIDYIRPANGGSSTEFKNITIRFQGDPLALYNKPAFNIIDANIIL